MNIKPLDAITTKWSQRASQAGPAYTAGVNNPRSSWATQTSNADAAWAAGVNNAVSNGSFKKGVAKAGDSRWQAGAVNKGAQRYGPGVQAPTAQANFSSGFGPYAAVLQGLNLPTRAPKGDPANATRSQAVATALHAKKMGK